MTDTHATSAPSVVDNMPYEQRIVICYLVICYQTVAAADIVCPPGWHGPDATSTKCMRLTEELATHEGCASVCGANSSLACIQTQEEDDLAGYVQWTHPLWGNDLSRSVWLGEYQSPVEPWMKFDGFETIPSPGRRACPSPVLCE